MKHSIKSLFSLVLALALVLTSGTASTLFSAKTADAAAKAGVSLNKTTLSFTGSGTKKLTIQKTKIKKIKSQTWSSSKKKVASVNQKGKVTAKSEGTATIKCKVKYIAKGSKKTTTTTLKCTVTVTGIGEMRTELSSQDLVEEMGLGINLGNTMEATFATLSQKYAATSVSDFETAWGEPVTTKELIDSMHSYGINTLRIPIAWSNGDNDDGTYTISEDFLDRVEEIVNYALDNDMYVIINEHYDCGWWGEFGAAKYDENGNLVADEEMRAKAWERYERYWTQIAEHFKDYSDHLIFEGANEELGERFNDAIYPNGYVCQTTAGEYTEDQFISGILTEDECYETMNQVNQLFVDTVRATGGNNTSRHLIIAGWYTNIDKTTDARFQMPTDDANTVNKLFVSVHYYDPWSFCGDGSTGTYTEEDRENTKTQFAKLQRFIDEGYAVFVGECGVCNPTGVSGDVVQWLSDTYAACADYCAVPCLWDTGEYFDRNTNTLKFSDVAELFNSITGANGDTGMDRVTGIAAPSTVEITEDMTPVWSWTGKWYKNGGDNLIGDDKLEENGGTKVSAATDADGNNYFIPESVTTATIDGDTTSIEFNPWGYYAYVTLDMSKYTNPAVYVTFLDGTGIEDNIGTFQLGAGADTSSASKENDVSYSEFYGKAVILKEMTSLSEENPCVYLSFSFKPIVTGIYIYELGD